MAMRLGNMVIYGMSEFRKGYQIYYTQKMVKYPTPEKMAGSDHDHADSISSARAKAYRTVSNGKYKFAIIFKDMGDIPEGVAYRNGIICWNNGRYEYHLDADGSIRNGYKL